VISPRRAMRDPSRRELSPVVRNSLAIVVPLRPKDTVSVCSRRSAPLAVTQHSRDRSRHTFPRQRNSERARTLAGVSSSTRKGELR